MTIFRGRGELRFGISSAFLAIGFACAALAWLDFFPPRPWVHTAIEWLSSFRPVGLILENGGRWCLLAALFALGRGLHRRREYLPVLQSSFEFCLSILALLLQPIID